MKFSFYKGPITNTTPQYNMTLEELYKAVSSDEYYEQVKTIRLSDSKSDRDTLKVKLDYITAGGTFVSRKDVNLISVSGYACIDIDKIDKIKELRERLEQDEYIALLFYSPSGNGLKAVIKIPVDAEQYSSYVEGFYMYLHRTYKIPLVKLDKATRDISRACFMSYDDGAYYNDDSTEFNHLAEDKPRGVVKLPDVKTKGWVEDFLINYCTSNVLPEGSRHNTVEKNLAILVRNRKDKNEILNKYVSMQGQDLSTFNGWLSSDEYKEVSSGELVNYIRENKIDFEIPLENPDDLREQVLLALAIKKRDTATELIVKAIMEENYIYTTRDDVKSEMWIYDDGIYIPQGKTYVSEFTRKVLGEAFTTSFCNQVVAKIEADTYINQEQFFDNNIVDEIAIKNGVLNLITREITEYSPNKVFFNKIPVTYDKDATCEAIETHFKAVLKHEEDVPVMYEIFGYLLWKEYFIEKSVMFSGCGRNGKSKTVDLMKRFIGADNCANIPLQDLETKPFALSGLFSKMANLSADLSSTALKTTGNFKTLTGRDMISADRKFLPRINFVNYAKMIFCANELPKTYDETAAFWNRWEPLEFPHTFVSKKEYDMSKDKTGMKIADTEIIKKLTIDSELSGLLNSALNGLDRLRQQKDFSGNQNAEDIKHMWIRKSDSFSAFLMDECEEDFDNKIPKNELSMAYSKYCRHNKLKPKGTISVKNTMSMKGYYDSRNTINEEFVLVWNGIKLKQRGVLQ